MRARSIKPGFFKNADLAEIEPLGRILFAGLWCLADRAGRLHDRVKQIKAEVLPYDDFDVNAALAKLSDKKFLTRYEVNGEKYVQINNFSKHQNPHPREKESTCLGMDKARPKKGQAMPRHGRAGLTPDSPFLTPDSGYKDIVDPLDQPPPEPPDKAPTTEGPTPQHLVDLWNQLAHPNLPRVAILTDRRKKTLVSRLKEYPDKAFWTGLVARINSAPHLRGENDRGWVAAFDWVLNPANLVKILEGNYDRKR